MLGIVDSTEVVAATEVVMVVQVMATVEVEGMIGEVAWRPRWLCSCGVVRPRRCL